jgi:hypothetical protein
MSTGIPGTGPAGGAGASSAIVSKTITPSVKKALVHKFQTCAKNADATTKSCFDLKKTCVGIGITAIQLADIVHSQLKIPLPEAKSRVHAIMEIAKRWDPHFDGWGKGSFDYFYGFDEPNKKKLRDSKMANRRFAVAVKSGSGFTTESKLIVDMTVDEFVCGWDVKGNYIPDIKTQIAGRTKRRQGSQKTPKFTSKSVQMGPSLTLNWTTLLMFVEKIAHNASPKVRKSMITHLNSLITKISKM